MEPRVQHQNYVPDEAAALLTAATLRVLHGLLHYRSRLNGRCCPRISTIGTHLHLSETTIKHHVRRLRALGIMHARRGRYSNQYEFAPTDQWASLIRSNGMKCRPSDRRKSDPQIGGNPTLRSAEIRLSDPPLSLYEPSDLNLLKRTAVPPPHSSNKRARSESSHNEKPAAPVVGGAAAVSDVKQRKTEQTPAPSRSAPSTAVEKPSTRVEARPAHSARTIPMATTQTVLAGIEPKLAVLILRSFQRLMKHYPERGLPLRGLEVLAHMLSEAEDPEKLAKQLQRSCDLWRGEHWIHARTFVPQLWRWLVSGDWQFPPTPKRRRR